MVNSEVRLKFWDEKFQTKRRFTRAELFERFEQTFKETLSLRTFRTDMKELRERGAPLSIERFDIRNTMLDEDKKSHYSYHAAFSLTPKQPLTAQDAERINQAIAILRQFQHLPQFRDLETILFKLEHEAGIKPSSPNKNNIIAFDKIDSLRGLNRLEMLYNAIKEQQVLSLFYTEFAQSNIQTLLHPYFLKQYHNRWYIYGFDANENRVRPYALDRIERLVPTTYPFMPNREIDFDTFFQNRIGITMYGHEPFDTVVLRVQQPRASYMLTKPWHNSQITLEQTPQYVDFQFEILINKELEAQVLEFGKDVEVLQPLHFREQIQQVLQQALQQYG
ncbi:MAG: WYL domain-containing protein [Saprospiraceae bacterium]|nr:WYL domain-containing protein [Saprospiraceae bacterium]